MLATLIRRLLGRPCPCPACRADRGDVAAARNIVVAAYPAGVAIEFDRPASVLIMTRPEARAIAAAIAEAVEKGAMAVGRDA